MITRKIKNRATIINSIKLFLVDEVHVLGENNRGAVIEAVISRMKTYAHKRNLESNAENSMRFIAVSATIPNIDDVSFPFSSSL
jgi:ATP-dependent DNA helicase HFM1/MER3